MVSKCSPLQLEFTYNSTKQEDLPDEAGIEQMKKAISGKKIAIIGGHPNWISKLKKTFPDWSYIQINDQIYNDIMEGEQ